MKLSTLIIVPTTLALGAQAQLAQCRAACKAGEETMERFCRSVTQPALRAACWGLAVALGTKAGQTACENWCYWQWGAYKRDTLEARDDVSLLSDFALTGLVLGRDVTEKEWTA
ncbi:hypothetical protein QBC35DRAFT_396594 [Podospora australis]|uniref:Secreted protein n=1 Tax=Podospora australis TaxID=1536484 RepID=A0AAN7AD40_9PEZI|nr:hypothetical protein QBC35DRAFT_396594 [Podospora australis]